MPERQRYSKLAADVVFRLEALKTTRTVAKVLCGGSRFSQRGVGAARAGSLTLIRVHVSAH